MQRFTSLIILLALMLISSCTNSDKPRNSQGNKDSLVVVDSMNQQPVVVEKGSTSGKTPSPFVITALLTEGTYIEGQLPSSIDSGNWYALIGKEAGISEIVQVELREAIYEPSEGEDYA